MRAKVERVGKTFTLRGRENDLETLLRTYRRTRDPLIRELLVRRCLPLVRSLARRYSHCGEQLEDLVQVGSVGLIEAIDRYDPERGGSLAGFAMPTITGHIKNHLRDRTSCVRVPRSVSELNVRLRASRESLTTRLSRPPTLAEIASDAGVERQQVVQALETEQARALVPLTAADARLGEQPGTGVDPFDASDDHVLVVAALRALGERERRILHLRFFVGLSQTEIAREVGLSQVHVSRLIQTSLERMRAALGVESAEPVGTPLGTRP